MNIAVIGSGISGLTAAHLLSEKHHITLFEANDYIGGHTATKDIEIQGKQYAVDTGFIVYNDWTYYNFIDLMTRHNIPSLPTEMGFSVSAQNKTLEYCGNNLNTLFSDRRNLLRPEFWGMLKDIIRFNIKAKKDLENNRIEPGLTLFEYLQSRCFGQMFVNGYIIPMACAIWSSSSRVVKDFEALFFLRFFKNHGLLNLNNRPQWRVLQNGSRSYISALIAPFKNNIHTSTPVTKITRSEDHVSVHWSENCQLFDQVIIATHSDQALSLLDDADENEKEILSGIDYNDSSVLLHTDSSLLPRKKRAWSSWNFLLQEDNEKPVLTYNMNILQRLKCPETICVTINGDTLIDPKKVLGHYHYAHPQFSADTVRYQHRWSEINGDRRTWFCGAYWNNGFHEDGVVSGIRVAESLENPKL